MMTQIQGFGTSDFNFLSNIETEFYEYLSFITDRAVTPGANIFGATARLLDFAFWLAEQKLLLTKIEFKQLLSKFGWKGEEKRYLKVADAFQDYQAHELALVEPRTIFQLAGNVKQYQPVIKQLSTLSKITQDAVRGLIANCRKPRQTKQEDKNSIWRRIPEGGRFVQIPPIHETDELTGITLQAMADAEGLTFQEIIREAVALRKARQNGQLVYTSELGATEEEFLDLWEQDEEVEEGAIHLSEAPVNALENENNLVQDSWNEPQLEQDDKIENYQILTSASLPVVEKTPVDFLVETLTTAHNWQEISEALNTHSQYKYQAWEILTPLERRHVIEITPSEVQKLSNAKRTGKITDFREVSEGVYEVKHNGCLSGEVVIKLELEAFLNQLDLKATFT
jgi:hypothetical protein